MRLFLDTANIEEIRKGASLGVITGVTTNPSLAAKEGIGRADSYKTAVQEIADIIDGPISVEVVSQDEFKTWIAEEKEKAASGPDLTPFSGLDQAMEEGKEVKKLPKISSLQNLIGSLTKKVKSPSHL